MEQQRWGESEKRREERRGEETRGEERRRSEKRKSQKKESKERVKRKSQKKESKERVKRKSQKKESKERVKRKRQKKESKERVKRKKMQVREKVGQSRNTVFIQWFVATEGRKVGSLKRRARSHLARWDEKFHAVVVRSTFGSQNAQNTSCSGGFWKLRCRKSVRRCGTKHISKSKCTKDTRPGPLLEVDMSKKYTPLWREAHVQVKMCRTHQLRTTFGSWDIEKLHAVAARSTCRSQKCKKLAGSEHFWTFGCRFAWQAQGILHLAKVSKTWRFCSSFNYNHHYTTLHYNYSYNYNYNYITLQYPTPTLITLHL